MTTPLASGFATITGILVLLAAGGVIALAVSPPGSRTPNPLARSAIDGALVAIGALAVIDNVVFHWILGFHRFKDGWGGSIYIEVGLVILGLTMVLLGFGGLSTRGTWQPRSDD